MTYPKIKAHTFSVLACYTFGRVKLNDLKFAYTYFMEKIEKWRGHG